MPIHDWTKVDAGIFHDFHQSWIVELRNALNGGLLPPEYYALAEQVTGPFGPGVLTLQTNGNGANGTSARPGGSASVGLLEKPPKVQFVEECEADVYAKKADRVSIRHVSDDRVIAVIEVLSPGNKSSQHAIDDFLTKAWSLIEQGVHLLLIDLFPPTSRDPHGIHRLIWGDSAKMLPDDQPLTLVAYHAILPRRAYVEPTAVGPILAEMPLLLDVGYYVPVPLEETYQAAWRGVPGRWKTILGN